MSPWGRWLVSRWRIAVAAALCSVAVPAQAVTEIKVAAQKGTEPKFVSASAGQPAAIVGLCIDMLRAIERLAPELRFVGDQRWVPLARVEAELAAGLQDAACALSHTKERDARFIFIEPPMLAINFVLVARHDDTAVIRSWEDVRQLAPDNTVLVNQGFPTIKVLEARGGMRMDAGASTPEANLIKLAAGRGRFYFTRALGLQAVIRAAGLQDKLKVLPVSLYSSRLYLVVGQHVQPTTQAQLRHALAQLEASGELTRILKKWE